ncbi:MAG: cyclic nucleotide-binding domain-containing protein [Anaerolineales bacterium]|nr:cyclic nucleotide-binding domain-containing protein [Anaerolineales bacterium]
MDLIETLQGIELFDGLNLDELQQIASICHQRELCKGELLATEGKSGDDLFIITSGVVEVVISQIRGKPRVIINLGTGQIIGEMSLVDRGPRSATVRAIQTPTIVQAIHHDDFHHLCRENSSIGYTVMYNMAADLSFKLRHRNLSEQLGGRHDNM